MAKFRYLWNSKKLKKKQHLADIDGLSVCKVENGGTVLDVSSERQHDTKPVCQVCLHLESKKTRKQLRRKRPEKTRQSVDHFLRSWEWKVVRYEAIKQSSGKCEACGNSPNEGAILNVDHIIPRRKRPDLALDIGNLQVLCHECNYGKGNRDQTDWRRSGEDAIHNWDPEVIEGGS